MQQLAETVSNQNIYLLPAIEAAMDENKQNPNVTKYLKRLLDII